MTLPLDLNGLDVPGSHPMQLLAPPLYITVLGKPITQGSKTKTKWGMYDDNAKTLRPWREAVKTACLDILGDRPPLTGACDVDLRFYFDRPQSHYGTGRNAGVLKASAPIYPCTRGIGDGDKLVRACFDAMTDAGIWTDDCLATVFSAARRWTGPDMTKQGALIRVAELPR
jgi:Holliday junction resolvase RusA-like endonuclease